MLGAPSFLNGACVIRAEIPANRVGTGNCGPPESRAGTGANDTSDLAVPPGSGGT